MFKIGESVYCTYSGKHDPFWVKQKKVAIVTGIDGNIVQLTYGAQSWWVNQDQVTYSPYEKELFKSLLIQMEEECLK